MLIISVRGGTGFVLLIYHCKAVFLSASKEQSAELIKQCCRFKLNIFSNILRRSEHRNKWCALLSAL